VRALISAARDPLSAAAVAAAVPGTTMCQARRILRREHRTHGNVRSLSGLGWITPGAERPAQARRLFAYLLAVKSPAKAGDVVERAQAARRPWGYANQVVRFAQISAWRRRREAAIDAIATALRGVDAAQSRCAESALRREMIALVLLEGPGETLRYAQLIAAFECKFEGRTTPPSGVKQDAYYKRVSRGVRVAIQLGASPELAARLLRQTAPAKLAKARAARG